MIHIKVYICTSGCYSDYHIDRVFLDRDVAENYKQMLYDANDVKVYETDDDLIRSSRHIVEQYAMMNCRYGKNGFIYAEEPYIKTEHKCDVDLHPNYFSSDEYKNMTTVCDWYPNFFTAYRKQKEEILGYTIRIRRVNDHGNELTEDRITKILHDIDAVVRAKLAEGFSIDDIAKLFEHYDAEGEVNEDV